MTYFLKGCPSLVTINGLFAGRLGENVVRIDSDEDELNLLIQPIESVFMSFCAVIALKDGMPVLTHGTGNTVRIAPDCFEITVIAPERRCYLPSTLLSTAVWAEDTDQKIVFSLVRDSYTQIVIEEKTKNCKFILADGLENINMKADSIEGTIIFALTASKGTEQYLFVALKKPEGEFTVCINTCAVKIQQEKGDTLLLLAENDIAARASVMRYSSTTFELKESYLVYLANLPVHTQKSELVPIAFFEAVRCGDYAEAKTYLSKDLSATMGVEEISAFLAPYTVIAQNAYLDDYAGTYLLYDKNNSAAVYNFTLTPDGLIDNISEVELG